MIKALRFRRRIVLICAAAIALVGVGGAAAALTSHSSAKLTTITVGFSTQDVTLAPFWTALDKGYFKKQGLDVKFVTFSGGSATAQAVAGGSVNIGVGALGDVVSGVNQGVPFKVVYGGFNMPIFSFWAAPGITSVAAGKGKRWGITRPGSSTDFVTRFLLTQNGMNPNTDVTLIPDGGSVSSVIALAQSGQMDVVIDDPPDTGELKKIGWHKIASQSSLMGGYPFHVEYAMAPWLQNNVPTMRAFLRGLVQGINADLANPKLGQAEDVKNGGWQAADVAEDWNVWTKFLTADGRLPSQDQMNTFWQIAIAGGQFTAALPSSKYLDGQWIATYPKWVTPKPVKKKK
ncbi:MAG TPA: ABC transporter substrate-binding protein [Gaiellaceae bacterium]